MLVCKRRKLLVSSSLLSLRRYQRNSIITASYLNISLLSLVIRDRNISFDWLKKAFVNDRFLKLSRPSSSIRILKNSIKLICNGGTWTNHKHIKTDQQIVTMARMEMFHLLQQMQNDNPFICVLISART